MLLSSTLRQHVGEASADTDTEVVGDAAGGGRAAADRGRAAHGVALTYRRSEARRDAAGRGGRRETSTDAGAGPVGERTRRRRCPAWSTAAPVVDLTEVEASPDGEASSRRQPAQCFPPER